MSVKLMSNENSRNDLKIMGNNFEMKWASDADLADLEYT